jgi:hypothetical protein
MHPAQNTVASKVMSETPFKMRITLAIVPTAQKVLFFFKRLIPISTTGKKLAEDKPSSVR